MVAHHPLSNGENTGAAGSVLVEFLKRVARPESFPPLFVFLIVTGYLIRPNPTWAFPFYAAMIPLGLWALWRHRHAVWLRDTGLLLSLLAIGWFGLSISWSVGASPERLAKYAGSWLTTSLFVGFGVMFFTSAPRPWQDRLFALLPWVAVLNTLLSIALWLHAGAPTRLHGWAETRHPILGANVMILAGIIALARPTASLSRPHRIAAAAALLCVTVFVLMTGSRGPLIAWGACIVVFGLLRGWGRVILPLMAAGVVATGLATVMLWDVPATSFPGPLDSLVDRIHSIVNRPSYRLEIWQMTLAEWTKAPVIGWGAATRASLSKAYLFPHSLYLSTLYYTGLIGMGLLVTLLIHLAVRVWRIPDREQRAFLGTLLTLPAVAGLTDLSGLIEGPGELWYILWLPVVIIIGRTFTPPPDEARCGS